jgi:hypothetical protein
MGGGWSAPRPGRFTPGKEIQHPLYRRLSEPQDQSGRVSKISSARGFDPRTVQPVASHYTDWAIAAHCSYKGGAKLRDVPREQAEVEHRCNVQYSTARCGISWY